MSTSPSLVTTLRSDLCGTLRAADAGRAVRLGGWVHTRRNLGGLVFLDLRDRTGIVQISFDPSKLDPSMAEQAAAVGKESVVLVEGTVSLRGADQRNPELETGDVEVRPTSFRVAGPATTPAIPVARGKGDALPAEEQRLRHRYLDLRRPELQQSLMLRHRLMQVARRLLSDAGYLEIETPILTRPTPEGARDYLVPSRVHPGQFYALPQSPQIYKQLLMVAGYDRYFQIARCFRDEDLRADRQPEFTQIDIEASFVMQEDILALGERLLGALWAEGGHTVEPTFRRMTYADAMERFGIDRPDLRYGLEIFDASDAFRGADFGITRTALEQGGRVRGIRVPGGAALSRKQVEELETLAKSGGAGGLLRVKRVNGVLEGPIAKFLEGGAGDRLGLQEGELALFVAAREHVTNPSLDRVRQELAKRFSLADEAALAFVWVVDFPMFEKHPETGVLASVHHPFTAPNPDDLALLDTAPEKVRAVAYDVVLNGLELGGGSMRINDPALQRRVFALLGIDDETAETRFGFLLEGLRAGAPPHGGIAFGFDRVAMLLAKGTSLRDVIAFPKTTAARALFEDAPAVVPIEDLKELHIRVEDANGG
ncbi:MAG: aspartate--tRNA ligase [Gemmatimonadaceae bacterium]